uniref:Uncharacterized protein n=1 Tax=Apteryx owenii TaxID=8824 RepID=A0A8B9QGY8_APTOW
ERRCSKLEIKGQTKWMHVYSIVFPVAVHGGFSDWFEWRPCSVTCGQGVQERIRQCNNPLPANGGRRCEGPDTDARSLDGNWSEWGLWEECSKSCGQGNRTRTRTCSDPPAQHGGKPCKGSAVESVMCNIRPCPVDGEWSSWLPWGPCSETCGKGTQSRLRLCNNPPPSNDGSRCEGSDTQTQVCNKRRCPGKVPREQRQLVVSFPNSTCFLSKAVMDGKWAAWTSWSACTVSCGGGSRQRTRHCSDPAPQFGGHKCEGNDIQIDFCNSDPCPSKCFGCKRY